MSPKPQNPKNMTIYYNNFTKNKMETMYEQQIKDLVLENESLKNETSQMKIWLINHINKTNNTPVFAADQNTRDDTLRRGVSPSPHTGFKRSRSKRSSSFQRQIE